MPWLALALWLALGVLIALILRPFWLWYWNISRIVDLLESINSKLSYGEGWPARPSAAGAVMETCPICKQPTRADSAICDVCGNRKK